MHRGSTGSPHTVLFVWCSRSTFIGTFRFRVRCLAFGGRGNDGKCGKEKTKQLEKKETTPVCGAVVNRRRPISREKTGVVGETTTAAAAAVIHSKLISSMEKQLKFSFHCQLPTREGSRDIIECLGVNYPRWVIDQWTAGVIASLQSGLSG